MMIKVGTRYKYILNIFHFSKTAFLLLYVIHCIWVSKQIILKNHQRLLKKLRSALSIPIYVVVLKALKFSKRNVFQLLKCLKG